FPLMQALFLLITLAVLVAILLADIATALLDPRTRAAGRRPGFSGIPGPHHDRPTPPRGPRAARRPAGPRGAPGRGHAPARLGSAARCGTTARPPWGPSCWGSSSWSRSSLA